MRYSRRLINSHRSVKRGKLNQIHKQCILGKLGDEGLFRTGAFQDKKIRTSERPYLKKLLRNFHCGLVWLLPAKQTRNRELIHKTWNQTAQSDCAFINPAKSCRNPSKSLLHFQVLPKLRYYIPTQHRVDGPSEQELNQKNTSSPFAKAQDKTRFPIWRVKVERNIATPLDNFVRRCCREELKNNQLDGSVEFAPGDFWWCTQLDTTNAGNKSELMEFTTRINQGLPDLCLY